MEWQEQSALVALNAIPSLGPARIQEMVKAAGSAASVAAEPERWSQHCQVRTRLRADELQAAWEHESAALAALGAVTLTWADPGYPECLRHLDHPPPVLAVRGNAGLLGGNRLWLAVVGARACTPYGRGQAQRFGAGLAAGGVVVISGGARGIDRAAMEGALRAGGPVAGVLGSGLGSPYPPEGRGFFDAMVEAGGALLSEFPCGAPPSRGNFPRRNRILAALARGVLVVQATGKSGSMITVGWALTLGRDVFAVPGSLESVVSRGPHQLIREGAMLVESPTEILRHYETGVTEADLGEEPPLLAALCAGDRSLEELAAEVNGEPELLLLELVEMELRGRVTRLPGGLYHRCGPARHA